MKFFGYDENMESPIAKIDTPKLSLLSDLVAPEKAYISIDDEGNLVLQNSVLVAVGNSVFKTEETILTSEHFDSTVSAYVVGKDYYIYICDPTDGDESDLSSEMIRISLNSTYPSGFDADNSRKIGGFHYGVVRNVNENNIPISTNGTAFGSGWKANVKDAILPNSVWTLLNRPTCDPTGMAKVGSIWVDIYDASSDGEEGLVSVKGVNPITGTEGLDWYVASEKAARVGKRLPSYSEFCQYAYGAPQGEDSNNTNAWAATSNTARCATGTVRNAVSAYNIRDAVGNVWEWLDELLHDPTAASGAWYDVMPNKEVGQIYTYSNTALHALFASGNWNGGARAGSRCVGTAYYPWDALSSLSVRCVCDSL